MSTWLPIPTSWMASARRWLPALPAHDLLRDGAYRRLLDVDPDQLVRRAGDDARAAADRGGAAAREPDADGPADGDGDAAVRAVLAAGRRLARPRPEAAGLHRRRADDRRSSSPACRSPGGLGWLSIAWLYVCGFVIGTVYTIAGSAAQIVLTQVVARERLVEAHAKNALASSGAEVAGPGPGRRADQARRRAAGAARRRGAGDGLGGDPARRRASTSRRAAARRRARGRAVLARPQGGRALRRAPSAARRARRSPSAAGRRATRRRSSSRSCSRRARSASPSRRSA